jgi:maltose phosphorylase
MRIKNDAVYFNPQLPKAWKSLSFKINFRGSVLELSVSPLSSKVSLIEGDPVSVFLNDQAVSFDPKTILS